MLGVKRTGNDPCVNSRLCCSAVVELAKFEQELEGILADLYMVAVPGLDLFAIIPQSGTSVEEAGHLPPRMEAFKQQLPCPTLAL